jgi:hypothetical protein
MLVWLMIERMCNKAWFWCQTLDVPTTEGSWISLALTLPYVFNPTLFPTFDRLIYLSHVDIRLHDIIVG